MELKFYYLKFPVALYYLTAYMNIDSSIINYTNRTQNNL